MNYNTKKKFEQETNKFLDILDPYQSDKITLSDVVILFSNQMVDEKKNNKTMLINNVQNNIDLPFENYGSPSTINPNTINFLDKSQPFSDYQENQQIVSQITPQQVLQNQPQVEKS